jgi:hypothetical protein
MGRQSIGSVWPLMTVVPTKGLTGGTSKSLSSSIPYDCAVSELDRRTFLKAAGIGTLVTLPLGLSARVVEAATKQSVPGFLSTHEYDVIEEATARLIPGPTDDPEEVGHPGAREAMATRYIDTLLGALSRRSPWIFAGGPFSTRGGNSSDDMSHFLGLTPAQHWAWSRRLADWQDQYRRGVIALDRLVEGSFSSASSDEKDAALAKDPSGFTTLLFGHAIEAMYSVPEYGGNHNLVGWKEIGFPGDVEPRGYSDSLVSNSSGPDPYVPNTIGTQVLNVVSLA